MYNCKDETKKKKMESEKIKKKRKNKTVVKKKKTHKAMISPCITTTINNFSYLSSFLKTQQMISSFYISSLIYKPLFIALSFSPDQQKSIKSYLR